MSDYGVGAAGGLVCQNYEEHDIDGKVKMQPGPYTGVKCPECGRMAGGGPPLDIPYVDEPPRSEPEDNANGGEE